MKALLSLHGLRTTGGGGDDACFIYFHSFYALSNKEYYLSLLLPALLALRTMRPLLLVIVCYHLLSIVGSLQNQDNLAPFIYVPRACLFFFFGHVVLKQGALAVAIIGCQEISDIWLHMCRSFKYLTVHAPNGF